MARASLPLGALRVTLQSLGSYWATKGPPIGSYWGLIGILLGWFGDGWGWFGMVLDGWGWFGMVWDGLGWFGDDLGWFGMVLGRLQQLL